MTFCNKLSLFFCFQCFCYAHTCTSSGYFAWYQKSGHFKNWFSIFSSPEQRELLYYPCWHWRWCPQMLKFSLKFLRPHYLLTLSLIWFIFGIIIHIGPYRSSQGQGHRLRIFMLKFYVKVFRTSSFFYLIDKHEFKQAILFGDRSCYFHEIRLKDE